MIISYLRMNFRYHFSLYQLVQVSLKHLIQVFRFTFKDFESTHLFQKLVLKSKTQIQIASKHAIQQITLTHFI